MQQPDANATPGTVPASASLGSAPATRRAVRLALAVVCLAVFLTALDQTVVVTALVSMLPDLRVPDTALDHYDWIVSGYLLGYVIAMPLMGRVADVFGRRRIFIICLTIFGVGSVLCALAPALGAPDAPDTSTITGMALDGVYVLVQPLLALAAHVGVDPTYPALDVIVAARFLQALGGGALVPVALAVVGDLFGAARRGLALGLLGAVAEAGGVLGPLWGAWLTGTWGWQWIFWLNLPIVVILIVLGVLALPVSQRQREGIDLPGALLFGAAIATLTIGLGGSSGQTGALTLTARANTNPILLAAAAIFLLAFVLVESRLRWPVIDLTLFKRRAFSAAGALSFLVGAALIVAMVEVPLYVLAVLGRPSIDSGLALLRLTALIPVGALAGGWLSTRLGCPITAVLGCLFTAGGFWLMHLWSPRVDLTSMTPATIVAGLGFGLVIAPITTSALNAVRATQSGSASAIITVLRMVGMIVALAALAAWGYARFESLIASHSAQLPGETLTQYASRLQVVATLALHQVLTDTFAIAAVLCVLSVIPALMLWRRTAAAPGAASTEAVYESYVAPLA